MLELTPENFRKHTIRAEYGSRGGGIEIDLTPFGFEGHRMTAYQNYLGGGMLGRVCSDNTFTKSPFINEKDVKEIESISLELKKYFHFLTNPDGEWESKNFEQNQKLPISVY